MNAMAARPGSGWLRLAAALDRLAPEAPAAVAAGRAALQATLAPLESSAWPEVAWCGSDLAPGGFPAELIWRPDRPGLFWTAEVAPPEAPAQARLPAALARLATLGALPLQEEGLALARRAGAMADHAHSVWIGGRHEPAGTSWKLYVGTPPDARCLAPRFGAFRFLSSEGVRLFMLGLGPDGGAELYWRRRCYEPGDLAMLGRVAGLQEAAGRLRDALAALGGRDPDLALEGRRVAISLSLAPDGAPEAMALYVAVPLRAFGEGTRPLDRLADAGPQAGGAMATLWRDGTLQPSWLGATAQASAVRWHAGLYPSAG
jgi:hypothetical protein